jgi:hypothetical protein
MAEVTTQDRFLMIMKLALDHNTNIVERATLHIMGDDSARNKSHQKRVYAEFMAEEKRYQKQLDDAYKELIAGFLPDVKEGESDVKDIKEHFTKKAKTK